MSGGINTNLAAASYEQEVVYKECRHNHAASLGRVAYDGCREFLNGGGENDMVCAACGCHRSFHHKATIYNPMPMPIPQTQPDNIPSGSGTGSRVQLHQQFRGINNPPEAETPTGPRSRKKRTMFTVEQRNRMIGFAERLGWRPQRADKEQIQGFCVEMGISRRMFLVWLSNNRRRAMQQHQHTSTSTTTTTTTTVN